MTVSIIVPVYNVEKYIRQCIKTIIEQTYSDLEIILIDDGSTDNSGVYCDEAAKKDSRIHVIHKENGGLSDARNRGLEYAKGELIYYLDSDDYIEPNTIQVLLEQQKKENADIVISNFYYTYSEHEDIANSFYKKKIIFNNYDAMKALINGKLETFAWGKLIRTNIVKKYLFPKGKRFEDHYWTHYIFGEAKNIVFIPNPTVHYRQRENSISYTYNLARLDVLDGWIDRKEYLEKYYPELVEICMQQYAKRYVSIAWLVFTRMKKEKKKGFQKMRFLNSRFHLQNYTRNKKLICALEKSNLVYAIWAIIYKIRGER